MSEENILVPKSRYDRLVANSAKESEIEIESNKRDAGDNETDSGNNEESVQDLSPPTQNEQTYSEQNSIRNSHENKMNNEISPKQSPGRTMEDISTTSVPHSLIRPPGTKILSETTKKITNDTKKLGIKKRGKKSVSDKVWIKW